MVKFTNKLPRIAIPSGPLKTIFILTYVSLVISPIIFLFSMLDLGITALFTNISIPLLAIAYHTTILILHRRHARRTNETQTQNKLVHPTATIASLVCAYLLAIAYLIPLGLVPSIGISFVRDELSFVGNMGTMVVQVVLDAAEVGILMALAVISTRMRHRAHKWVQIDEVNLSATVKS